MRPLYAFGLALGLSLTPLTQAAEGAPAPGPTAATQRDLVQTLKDLSPLLETKRGLKGFPEFSEAELRRAERGEVAVKTVPIKGADMPLIMIGSVLPYPVEALYLVLADVKSSADWIPALDHAVVLSQEEGGRIFRAFNFASAPFPAQDRTWVSRTEHNRELFELSGGRYWEIWWEMDQERSKAYIDGEATAPVASLDSDKLKGSVSPRICSGSWVLVPLGDHSTFVQYSAYTDPNANMVERSVMNAMGSRIQEGMFKDGLIPLAKAYSEGKRDAFPTDFVDMQGKSSKGLIDRLKHLTQSP